MARFRAKTIADWLACSFANNTRWLHVSSTSDVDSPKIFEGAKNLFFKRTTVFCLGYRLSKHKTTGHVRNLVSMAPLAIPWLRLWSTQCNFLQKHNA